MVRPPFNPNLIQVPPEEPPPGRLAKPDCRRPQTVSQVTAIVKQALETALPSTLYVIGEISNFKRHSSGHLYFTLKDRHSELSCVMWRSAAERMKFTPGDGLEVIATGRIEVFERAGRYQLYVRKIEPRGIGALELAFRQLCEKLDGEGLFDERFKKPLPPFPQRIAVVTSPTGAAFTDIVRTLQRRFPCVEVLLFPVRVQGDGAADEVAAAVRRLNAASVMLGGIDLMIVGRGGGSLEDLWSFNEECVARAIHRSLIPVISAVGHEVDVTIADLVADVRAATPTAAAELAVPVRADLLTEISAQSSRMTRALHAQVEILSTRLSGVDQRTAFRDPLNLLFRREQVVDELSGRMHRTLVERVHSHRPQVDRLDAVVQQIEPHVQLLRRSLAMHDAQRCLDRALSHRLADSQHRAGRVVQRLTRVSPESTILRHADRLDQFAHRLTTGMRHGMSLRVEYLRRREECLCAMSYKSVLGRGFSITRTKRGRRVVRSLRELTDCQRVVTEVLDGEFESSVVNLHQLELFE